MRVHLCYLAVAADNKVIPHTHGFPADDTFCGEEDLLPSQLAVCDLGLAQVSSSVGSTLGDRNGYFGIYAFAILCG